MLGEQRAASPLRSSRVPSPDWNSVPLCPPPLPGGGLLPPSHSRLLSCKYAHFLTEAIYASSVKAFGTNHPEEAFHHWRGRLLDRPVGAIGGGNFPSMLLGTTSLHFFITGYEPVLCVA